MEVTNNIISFDAVTNFRDIGGHHTKDGKQIKTGVLFRSDELSRMTTRDIGLMNELRLKLICDLRTASEQESKKSRMLKQGIEVKSISIQDKSQEYTHFELMKLLVYNNGNLNFEQMMKDMYHHMAFGSQDKIREIICLLSDAGNVPALIHCTGGKDRTGFVTAIIQLFLGVHYESVMMDYLYSNVRIGPRMKKVEKFIRLMSLYRVSPERIKPMLEVRRDYLEEVLYDILKQYGSIEAYLIRGCCIPEKCLESFKQNLID
ncbi:protein-tyrosine phosphatase [Paenibacillus sp. cl141a]|uniref:tyrosine-protein phosphatase n=1 Tax=Paenibacillus sp. cl141a TaxID=1761877 RepID=UPI0008B80B2E|nr:tyrosine-protein phosphatase [Paenibacillus sp. cl141a]SEL99701.1 protein-tyrosine phosphatase [Paenibacillus sp. cl141a]